MDPQLEARFVPKWWWRLSPGFTKRMLHLQEIALSWDAKLEEIERNTQKTERTVSEFLAVSCTTQCESGLEFALATEMRDIDAGQKQYLALLEDCTKAEDYIAKVLDIELSRELEMRIGVVRLEVFAQLRSLPTPLFDFPA